MVVCESCGRLWSTRLARCGHPDCDGAVRRFGSDAGDWERPVVCRFPFRRVRRPPTPAGPGGPPGVLSLTPVPPAVPAGNLPPDRAPLRDWRAAAVTAGWDPDEVAEMNKADLRALLSGEG